MSCYSVLSADTRIIELSTDGFATVASENNGAVIVGNEPVIQTFTGQADSTGKVSISIRAKSGSSVGYINGYEVWPIDSTGSSDSGSSGGSTGGSTGTGSGSTGSSSSSVVRAMALSGLEYNGDQLPGSLGTNYFAAANQDYAYFKSKNINVIRLPFLWARLQPTLNGPLDATQKGILDDQIALAKANGQTILLDCHDYGGRSVNGTNVKIGTDTLPISAFADFWSKMSTAYKDETGVWGYDLMNEPVGLPVEQLKTTYSPFRDTIQLITNPGYAGGITDNWYLDSDWALMTSPLQSGYAVGLNSTGAVYKTLRWKPYPDTGLPIKPNTTYTFSCSYSRKGTGAVDIRVSTGNNYGESDATSVTQTFLDDTTGTFNVDYQRFSITFTTSATQNTLFFGSGANGFTGQFAIGNWNLTETATLQTYKPYAYNGTVATNSLMMQAAIDAIRATGDQKTIVMEVDAWAGLQNFTGKFGPDADIWWNDPLNKTMLSFHYYMDPDYSGVYSAAWTQDTYDRIEGHCRAAFNWAAANNVEVFIGEYGSPSDTNYLNNLTKLLTLMDEYGVHGAYWASGSTYTSATSAQPTNNYTTDKPVMAIITAHQPTS